MVGTLITNAAIVTVDGAAEAGPVGTEYARGWLAVREGVVAGLGPGDPDPAVLAAAHTAGELIDATGCLLVPGYVNTHHHLYQWATRGFAVDGTLFEWLTTLYPVWGRLDAATTRAAARLGLARLALTGCTTSTDHHYVYPRGDAAAALEVFAATVEAAREVGLRFSPTRGSMDLGRAQGGLPPDGVVEDVDTILAATDEVARTFHDPAPGSMVRVGVAPCSPFSVTADLLRATASQARDLGLRMHTHLAETLDEADYCAERFGASPTEYLAKLDWLGPDVWLAHGVHFSDDDIRLLAATGTGVAHCPSSNARLGSGAARVRELLDAGVPVGLGVDGAASSEQGSMADELRQALYTSRVRRGPTSMTSREALGLATMGGARIIGREREIGSLEVGKRADLGLWRVDGPWHADLPDPVDAIVVGPTPELAGLWVEGRRVVDAGRLTTVDLGAAADELGRARRALLDREPGEAGSAA